MQITLFKNQNYRTMVKIFVIAQYRPGHLIYLFCSTDRITDVDFSIRPSVPNPFPNTRLYAKARAHGSALRWYMCTFHRTFPQAYTHTHFERVTLLLWKIGVVLSFLTSSLTKWLKESEKNTHGIMTRVNYCYICTERCITLNYYMNLPDFLHYCGSFVSVKMQTLEMYSATCLTVCSPEGQRER